MSKLNCWEMKKCGREPNGAKANELGVCPSATDTQNAGKNSGTNGGRYCWRIAGTLCGGKVQGTFAQKATNCSKCDFYISVKSEEGHNFTL